MTNSTSTLTDLILAHLAARRGQWQRHLELQDALTPTVTVERVAYRHELDDAETPGPSWAYGYDATGLADEQPGGTVDKPDVDQYLRALATLVDDARVERQVGSGGYEYRVS